MERAKKASDHLGAVPLLGLDLGADQLVGWLHGLGFGFTIARDHVVQLEAKSHQPAVHICEEGVKVEKQRCTFSTRD